MSLHVKSSAKLLVQKLAASCDVGIWGMHGLARRRLTNVCFLVQAWGSVNFYCLHSSWVAWGGRVPKTPSQKLVVTPYELVWSLKWWFKWNLCTHRSWQSNHRLHKLTTSHYASGPAFDVEPVFWEEYFASFFKTTLRYMAVKCLLF